MLEAAIIIAIVVAVQLYQTCGLPDGVAPPLAGVTSEGQPFDLAAMPAPNYSGGDTAPRLVVFWATWCPVCKAEAANIERVGKYWPVVSVAIQSGTASEVKAFLDARGAPPAVVDTEGRIAADWHVAGVPTHYILDAKGNVRFRVVGYATTPGLMARLWWAGRM